MYELSRIRLYSVGPAGARYEDVTIDLSKAGKPVERAQLELLGSTPLRPSPATVLFLENGGGKSVLIKLIFSVMLPGKRQIVGTSNTRVLEKFVERGDVGHVVLEWTHSETGRLLVTGKVSEWRRHKNSADGNLAETWYSLRPGPSMTISSLPFAEDGANLVSRVFRERLTEAAHEDPSLELFWADRHAKWEERLAALGIDPELFEYQRRMNAGEGEAADAFTFNTDEALVDFLLRAVVKDADTESLGESLGEYAKTLAAREALELEHDFVAATLGQLEPLARHHATAEAAKGLLAAHEARRNDFAASVARRIEQEQERQTGYEKDLETAKAEVQAADLDMTTGLSRLAELKRRVAGFQVQEAQRRFDATARRRDEAAALVQAWAATGALQDWTAKNAAAAQLREVLADRRGVEAAAIRLRDERAGALVSALSVTVASNEKAAAEKDGEAAEMTEAAKTRQTAHDEALKKGATAAAKAEALETSIGEVKAEVDQAVRDALVADAASVDVTADTLAEAAQAAEAEVTAQQGRLLALDAAVDNAQAALVEVRRTENLAQAEHDKAVEAVDNATRVMAELAGEPRLVELVESVEVVLETDAEALADRLTEALANVDRERTALRVEGAADERARLALDSADDALYPPHPEVEQLVELLKRERVQCYSGWDVLADLPDEGERRDLVARFPHLAAGVLLNDPDDLDRARRLVAAHGYEPSCVIAIASTQTFHLDPEEAFDLTPRGATGFLVPPKKAYYDHQAARDESARINQRHAEREQRIGELNARHSVDLALRARLRQWRVDYPPGRLAELSGWSTATAQALAEHQETTRERETGVDEAKQRREEGRRRLNGLTTTAKLAADRADRVGWLRERIAQATEWQRSAEQLRAAEESANAQADEQRAQRDELQAKASGLRREADRHRATVERLREEIVQAGGKEKADSDAPMSAHPVTVLRTLLREAEVACLQAQVGSELLAESTAADKAAVTANEALLRYASAARERAKELLKGPDGADAASRAAAAAAAGGEQDEAAEARDTALRVLSEHKAKFEGLPLPDPPVTLAEEPADEAHARLLLADAATSLREDRERLGARTKTLAVIEEKVSLVKTIITGLTVVTEALSLSEEFESATGQIPVEAYPGSPEAAREENGRLGKAVREARNALREAQKELQKQGEALRTVVSDTRYLGLTSHVRVQITTVAFGELSAHAAEWAAALQPRLRSLADDLAQSERHRAMIVARLQGMVDHALGTLRHAQRLSRLPAGLGDWSGEEFLRFTFKSLEADVLTQQLCEVIDSAAGDVTKRDGMTILLRGVRAAAPRGFKVTMLKPDAVLRTERVRVSEVRDVFSGGQHLTAAIMLYCTLAALRANSQGRAGRRHSGVLFLDNPIGRASAGYLLELQRAVATALGVQLIYTTGLFDAEALGAFPLIVRLRNDADIRAGRKYLSVDRQLQAALGTLAEPDGKARLSAGRLLLKERRHDQD